MAVRSILRFLLMRLGQTLLTLLGLASLVFLMIKLLPGDEAQMAVGAEASPEQIEAARQRLGLDAPVIVQYLLFLSRLVKGDLGVSTSTFQPVLNDLVAVFPSTLELVSFAMLVNLAVAVPSAIVAANKRGGAFDGSSRFMAVILGGLPVFWLALMLQYLLGTVWRLLPISGHNAYGMAAPVTTGAATLDALLALDWAALGDALRHIALPAVALAALFSTQIFRALRASLLGVLTSDFMMAVRAKGATARRVLLRHAVPNSVTATLALAGTQFGAMVGSSVLIESVFARKGVGAYMFNAVAQKDSFAVLGSVIFIGAVVCIANLIVDLLQLVVDPRVRAAQLGN
ncbi:ABC transporter permease [Devosia sp.]|uniref:ABC transporter permease n=1 Tax=Devosia sp. TaxID=1871048 RepID=UPI002F0D4093